MNTELPTNLIQGLEQFGAHAENIAQIVAGYYNTLLRYGVPEDLRDKLTIEFQLLIWAKSGMTKQQ